MPVAIRWRRSPPRPLGQRAGLLHRFGVAPLRAKNLDPQYCRRAALSRATGLRRQSASRQARTAHPRPAGHEKRVRPFQHRSRIAHRGPVEPIEELERPPAFASDQREVAELEVAAERTIQVGRFRIEGVQVDLEERFRILAEQILVGPAGSLGRLAVEQRRMRRDRSRPGPAEDPSRGHRRSSRKGTAVGAARRSCGAGPRSPRFPGPLRPDPARSGSGRVRPPGLPPPTVIPTPAAAGGSWPDGRPAPPARPRKPRRAKVGCRRAAHRRA